MKYSGLQWDTVTASDVQAHVVTHRSSFTSLVSHVQIFTHIKLANNGELSVREDFTSSLLSGCKWCTNSPWTSLYAQLRKAFTIRLNFNCDSSTNLVSLLGVHAKVGYSSCPVCLCVCLCLFSLFCLLSLLGVQWEVAISYSAEIAVKTKSSSL